MIQLYTQQEFYNAKSRTNLPLKCKYCQKTFYRTKNLLQISIKSNSNKTFDFCSKTCSKSQQPIIIICEYCQNSIKKFKCEINKTKHHFCCKSCAGKYNNAHKSTGTRTSKLEKWLQIQLPLKYPTFEFHFNRTNAINSELDIYIPILHLAFELNGIFHYEPIYGKEKLSKIQNNDQRKYQACIENNIELCIIDNSSMKNFKPIKAQKFLDIICNIINIKLLNNSSNI